MVGVAAARIVLAGPHRTGELVVSSWQSSSACWGLHQACWDVQVGDAAGGQHQAQAWPRWRTVIAEALLKQTSWINSVGVEEVGQRSLPPASCSPAARVTGCCSATPVASG